MCPLSPWAGLLESELRWVSEDQPKINGAGGNVQAQTSEDFEE